MCRVLRVMDLGLISEDFLAELLGVCRGLFPNQVQISVAIIYQLA
jgi:hypothetical protein